MQEDLSILANLNKGNRMELVKKYGQMDLFMKGNFKMGKKMEREFINGVSKVHIMDNGWII